MKLFPIDFKNKTIPVRQDITVLPADNPRKGLFDYKEFDTEIKRFDDYTVVYIYTKNEDLVKKSAALVRQEELELVYRDIYIPDIDSSCEDEEYRWGGRCFQFYETISCQDKDNKHTWFILAKDKDYYYACHDGVIMCSFPEQYNTPCRNTIKYQSETLEGLFNEIIQAGYTNLRTRINPHVDEPYEIDDKDAWSGKRSSLDDRTYKIHKQAMINLCKQYPQPLILYRKVFEPIKIYEELGICVINDYALGKVSVSKVEN